MAYSEFRTGVIRPVEVYKEAWELIKSEYWLIFAITLVGLIVGSAVPVILIGPMMCGIYLVLLNKADGRPIEFGQLFKGFDYFMPALVLAAIITLPTLVMIFGMYVPMIAIAFAGPRMSESEVITAIAGTIAVELVLAVVVVCLHTLLIFAFPLIVDRGMSGIEAIKTSARAVWQNLGGVAGLFGVGFVVAMVGYFALCVGMYLALPLILASTAVAYRKIFPAELRFSV